MSITEPVEPRPSNTMFDPSSGEQITEPEETTEEEETKGGP